MGSWEFDKLDGACIGAATLLSVGPLLVASSRLAMTCVAWSLIFTALGLTRVVVRRIDRAVAEGYRLGADSEKRRWQHRASDGGELVYLPRQESQPGQRRVQ
jgi:hypothetical protein